MVEKMLFFGCKMYQKEACTYLQIIIFAFGLVQSSFEGVCIVAMRVSFGDLLAIHISINRPTGYVANNKL